MSGSIRQRIGPTNKLLKEALVAVPKWDQETTAVSDDQVKGRLRMANFHLAKITKLTDNIEGYDKQWSAYLSGLGGADREAETDVFNQYAEESDYLTTLLNGHGAVAMLTAYRDDYASRAEDLARSVAPAQQQAAAAPAPANNVKIKPLELPTFGGDNVEFTEFWDAFNANIDARTDLTDGQKLQYLKSYLKGPAAQKLAGLSSTNNNYVIGRELLERAYDRKGLAVKTNLARLAELRCAGQETPALRQFFDSLVVKSRQLQHSGHDLEHNELAISLIETKLPRWVLTEVEEKKRATKDPWSLTALFDALEGVLEVREAVDTACGPRRPKTTPPTGASLDPTPTAAFHSSAKSNSSDNGRGGNGGGSNNAGSEKKPQQRRPQLDPATTTCTFCDEKGHLRRDCKKAVTPTQRRAAIEKKGLCIVCFRTHEKGECRGRPCFCGERHHPALCPKPKKKAETPQAAAAHTVSVDTTLNATSRKEAAVLGTAHVVAIGPTKQREAYVLLDGGAESTLVREGFAAEIGLLMTAENRRDLKLKVCGGNIITVASYQVNFKLQLTDGNTVAVCAKTAPTISSDLKRVPLHQADKQSAEVELVEPDVMLGIEYVNQLLVWKPPTKLPSGLDLVETRLGPVICGGGQLEGCHLTTHCYSNAIEFSISDTEEKEPTVATNTQLVDPVERMWQLEAAGITDDPTEAEDEIADRNFAKNITRDESGTRYETRWPWRIPLNERMRRLTPNLGYARGRLESNWKALVERGGSALRDVDGNFREMEKAGIIEESPWAAEGPVHYLAHFAKWTPKLRILFDAAAPVRGGVSLNKLIYRGPVKMRAITDIITRARLRPLLMTGDLEKAFLQVGLARDDRDCVRFLWLQDPEKGPVKGNYRVFRFCRLPFGVVASPYLLAAVIAHHLAQEDGELAQEILRDLYVDNTFTGADSADELLSKQREMAAVFDRAGMRLRDFVSNSAEANNATPPERRSKRLDEAKVLGLQWNTKDDAFIMRMGEAVDGGIDPATKRSVLSAVASIYDPQGWLGPAILEAKLLLQDIWRSGRAWDTELDVATARRWHEIKEKWRTAPEFKIPRRLHWQDTDGPKPSLHCYTDASARAYGAVVYLVCGNHAEIVAAKHRLAPTAKSGGKTVTIPRLELLGIDLGAKLCQSIKAALGVVPGMPEMPTHLWSDSQCALHWVAAKGKRYSRFVENRVASIHERGVDHFRFCTGESNPADIISRGMPPAELWESRMWWKGPEWLTEGESSWPTNPDTLQPPPEAEEEERTEPIFVSLLAPLEPIIDLERFGKWGKLLRTVGWLQKWRRIAKGVPNGSRGQLTAADLERAKVAVLRLIQAQHPPTEAKQLEMEMAADDDGLLRCGLGRLQRAGLSPQIYLPRHCHATRLLVRHLHSGLHHAGVSTTLNELTKEYWLPKGRQIVKSSINRCRVTGCVRGRALRYQEPRMGLLPAERLKPSAPFLNCGVDYFGPVPITNSQKAYGVLFCCFSTRAVHLEWALSASAAGFIMAWRRFIARRGRPSAVWSDCASNFRLAEKALKVADLSLQPQDSEFDNFLANGCIRWTYSVPLAPWSGGIYERLIRNTKEALRRSLGRRVLGMEELATVLCEVETTVNSRPLVYCGENERLALRPLDFLLPGGGQPGFPSLDSWEDVINDDFDSAERLLETAGRTERALEKFWQLWQTGYLAALRERRQTHRRLKRGEASRGPEVGEVVIVESDGPRACWKLGRVEELVMGTDGVCRAAKVKTAAGRILSRHVSALYPLEMEHTRERGESGDAPQAETRAAPEPAPDPQPPKHKYYTRLQAKRASFFTLLVGLLSIHSASGRECIGPGDLVYEPPCGPGFKIIDDGELCWAKVRAKSCDCGDWLECSPYNGSRTAESDAKLPAVRQWLRANQPNPCSWSEPGELCAPNAVHQDFYKVLLYDGSSHLLTNLQLRTIQTGEVQCRISPDSGGSPEYCMKRLNDGDSVCSVEAGKFCWLQNTGMLQAVESSFAVPIRAWTLTAVDVYPHRTGAECKNCSISCPADRPGHVHVRGGAADLIEVRIARRRTYLQRPASLEELSKPHRGRLEVSLRAWKHGWLIADQRTTCPATQLCPKCLLCKARLANPFCDTWATSFLLMLIANGAGLGVTLAILAARCCMNRCQATETPAEQRAEQDVEEAEEEYELPLSWPSEHSPSAADSHIETTFSRSRRPRSAPPPPPGPPPLPPKARSSTPGVYGNARRSMRWRSYRPVQYSAAAASVILVCGLGLTAAIPSIRTATIHSELCEDNGGRLECHFDTAVDLVLKPHETVRLTLLGNNNTNMGYVDLQLLTAAKVCNAVAEFYTRETLVQVQSRRLCPKEGSCVSEQSCLRVRPDDKIPELGPLANDNPGVTACRGGSACWLQGCLWCSTTCTFWREYALPSASDTSVYRVVSCNSWTMRYSLRLTTPDMPEGRAIQLESEYDNDHVSIRAESLSGPDIPALYTSKFLIGDGRAALLTEAKARAIPLHCGSHHQAQRFNCTLRSRCSCDWVGDSSSCNCPRRYVENAFAGEALPRHTPEMELEYWRDSVRAIYEVGDVRLRLQMRRLRAATVVADSSCAVQILSASGCYACHGGAEVAYRCDLNATGTARVAAQCGDTHLELDCDVSGGTKMTHASFQNAVLDYNCTAWCPGRRSYFALGGILNYVPEETEHEQEKIITSRNSPSEHHSDDYAVDWWAIWAFAMADWRRTTAIVVGMMLAFALFPGLLTCLLKCGFAAGKRGAEACGSAIKKKPDVRHTSEIHE